MAFDQLQQRRGAPAGSWLAAEKRPSRAGLVGVVALAPVILACCYAEVLLAVAATLDDLHAKGHHATGPAWLGAFALLGLAGPLAAALAAWHTKAEGRPNWQATLRAEMAFLLIGLPALFFLLMA